VKHYDNLGKYFQNPYLKAAFSFQNLYLGMSPYDAPATYSLLQYTELVDGVWMPAGGLYRVTESLVSIAEANGARFVYNAPVKEIQVNGRQATGVIMQDDSQLSADVIVANADLPYVYQDLLPNQREVNRLERMEYTCSAVMFYWGIDKVYPQFKTHNLFMAGDYRASFDRIFQDYALPDDPNFYLHAPTRTDPSAAPQGQDTLMILVPISRLNEDVTQDWDALKAQARSAVLRRLAEIGVHDLEEHIKFESCFTPHTWKSKYNIVDGAAFGSISHGFTQVGYLRPKNRHRRYRNLYFAGGSTHPGNGLPLVLLSAQLTTERILKETGAL
jgi:phytoene desaturase